MNAQSKLAEFFLPSHIHVCLVLQDERLRQSTGREEWMTSLPAIGLAHDIGLTARSFRSKGPAQQDNSWTKTPGGGDNSKVG